MKYEFKDYLFNPLALMGEIDHLLKYKESFKKIVNVPVEDLMYILDCIKNGVASFTADGSILQFKCDCTKSRMQRTIKCYQTMLKMNWTIHNQMWDDKWDSDVAYAYQIYLMELESLEYLIRYSKTLI